MTSHQLIGSPISYYTGKVRAYLRFKQIPFDEVLSSQEVFRNIIMPRVGYPIIPVVVSGEDRTLQDSTEIIDYFETQYQKPPIYPATPLQKLVALLMEVYGDDWLVIPAMHYRWNLPENRDHAIRQFGATSAPDASAEEQRKIGEERSARFAGMVPALGVTDKSREAIETSYLQLLSDLDAHFAQHPFLLGSRPSIGDYGLIGPLYAHLHLDPASGRIMEAHAPHVADWVRRMHDPQTHDGDFLSGDHVPDTLLPLLARMFSEQVPALMSTAAHLDEWTQANPGERKIPRTIGSHAFTIEGTQEMRGIFPANLWMWQRPHDHYRALNGDVQKTVQRLLAPISGAVAALEKPLKTRVVRENFRFLIEPRPEAG